MRIAGHMRRNGETISDAMSPRAGKHESILRREAAAAAKVAPMKTRRCSLACAVDGIGNAEPMPVEPMRPFFGVIMHAKACPRGAKEVDMMAKGEEFAAELAANLTEDIVQTGNIYCFHEVAGNPLGSIEGRHP